MKEDGYKDISDALPDSANVRQPVVRALYGFSDSTLWRHVAAGTIPKPRKLSARCTAWNVGQLRRALAAQEVVSAPFSGRRDDDAA